MDELNKHESDNLAVLIELILNQAKWLARALIVTGILGLASLVPLFNGPILQLLIMVMVWCTVGTMIAICVLALLAYYYVHNCVSQQLKRYIKQAKKEAGK